MKFREACRFGYEKYTSSFSLNTIQNLRNSFTLKCKPLSSAIAAHLVAIYNTDSHRGNYNYGRCLQVSPVSLPTLKLQE
jgi:hypothetical protein